MQSPIFATKVQKGVAARFELRAFDVTNENDVIAAVVHGLSPAFE